MLHGMMMVFAKDFKSYFQNNMIYVLVFVYALMSFGALFYSSNFMIETMSGMYQLFYFQPVVLGMIVPAITMRMWSDEYKHNTLEVLLAQPVRYYLIVAGKFLAVWAVCGVMMLPIVVLWAVIGSVVWIDGLWIVCNLALTMLLAACLIGLGMVAGIFCRNMVGAFVMGLALCAFFVSVPFDWIIAKFVPDNVILARLLSSFNLGQIYESMIGGQIFVSALVYMILMVLAELWIVTTMLEYRRS